jgi:hypothetical protein
MVVTTETSPEELVQRLAARNASLESRVLELEGRLGAKKRKANVSTSGCAADGRGKASLLAPLSFVSNMDRVKKGKRAAASVSEEVAGEVEVSRRTAARQREAAANAEIGRLKAELATLRAEGCSGYLAKERKREEGFPILPKRALSLAGYWNILPNDLLAITPALATAVESRGGTVIRREGMQLCFRGKERGLVVDAVLEIMPLKLPQYRRREEPS